MTHTIPIYYGCDSIGDYFNTKGMVLFNEVEEMKDILNNLSKKMYNEMLPYAVENFKMAEEYILSEDWMYNNIFRHNLQGAYIELLEFFIYNNYSQHNFYIRKKKCV